MSMLKEFVVLYPDMRMIWSDILTKEDAEAQAKAYLLPENKWKWVRNPVKPCPVVNIKDVPKELIINSLRNAQQQMKENLLVQSAEIKELVLRLASV